MCPVRDTVAIDEVQHGVGERLGGFLRKVVAGVGDRSMLATSGEVAGGWGAVGGGEVSVGGAVERDRRHGDRRLRREESLELDICVEAGGEAEPMSIRVDDHVDVVGVVERLGGTAECGVVETPVR